jgi:hypothetical protein
LLPFLKPKRIADTIIASRNSKGEVKEDQKVSDDMLKVAESLISAVNDKDASRVASCLKEAWACMESTEVENEQE